jgi:hypothetical protein
MGYISHRKKEMTPIVRNTIIAATANAFLDYKLYNYTGDYRKYCISPVKPLYSYSVHVSRYYRRWKYGNKVRPFILITPRIDWEEIYNLEPYEIVERKARLFTSLGFSDIENRIPIVSISTMTKKHSLFSRKSLFLTSNVVYMYKTQSVDRCKYITPWPDCYPPLFERLFNLGVAVVGGYLASKGFNPRNLSHYIRTSIWNAE